MKKEQDKGLVGVALLIALAAIVFFFILGFVNGIFQEMDCNQANRVWTGITPKRYIMRLIGEELPNPEVDEEVYMFGTCTPKM
jgi:hypothetical protein